MPGNNKRLSVFIIIITALFIMGVVRLFMLRFEAGDIYPAYSSMRSDPLGTRAFYESLNNLDNIAVTRNFLPLAKARHLSGATIFYLGLSLRETIYFSKDSFEMIEQSVAAGGRVVFSFLPVKQESDTEESDTEEKKYSDEISEDKNEKTDEEETGISSEHTKDEQKAEHEETDKSRTRFSPLKDRLDIIFSYDKKLKKHSVAIQAAGLADKAQLSKDWLKPVSWHSALSFEDIKNKWRTIYTRDGYPVIVEKNIGKGSIVLAGDSYFFSNEALRAESHPELLAWLTGNNTRVVFDEFHLGIRKNPGVMGLARKYRLHGLFLGVIVLSVLFVWKNSVYFVPPLADRSEGTNDVVSGKDYRKGLISLLRRNIRTQDILKVCIKEWKKSFPDNKGIPKNKLDELNKMENTIFKEGSRFAKQADIIRGYNKICKILSKKQG